MNDITSNILIVGVGGQGTLLASRIFGQIAMISGYQCKMTEVHGMSQRGGNVVAHVRIGREVFSPIVCVGEADYIISFEMLEAARWAHFLKTDGKILVSDQKIMPMPVITGKSEYPINILDVLRKDGIDITEIQASDIAKRAGSIRSINVVLIGVFCAKRGIDYEVAQKAVKICVKEKFANLNIKALKLGYDAANQIQQRG